MADGAIPQELKSSLETFHGTLATMRTKMEELEKQTKKGAEDAVTKAELKNVETAYDKLKDDINALIKSQRRQLVAAEQAKSSELETKANLEVATWIRADGDLAKGAAHRLAYKSAFDKLTRRGKGALSVEETKTLSAGSAPDGGFFVEPVRGDMIITRLRETSPMREIASTVTISSNSIKYPVDRDDVGYEWVSEQGTRNTTDTPQVGEIEIPVHEISAMPKATQNLLDDASVDVESWLNQKVADRFARAENTAFVSGNGTSRPAGFLSQSQGTFVTTSDATRAFGALQYIATGVSGGFAVASGATVSQADKLLDLIYAFMPGYRGNLRWTMNRTTLAQVRKFKDQQGNYIYNPVLSAGALVDTVFGYPVTEFSDMADYSTANAFAIALGDFRRGYLIVDRQGIRQLRDPYTDKPRVIFYTTRRVGGAIMDSDAIKVLKFGTS